VPQLFGFQKAARASLGLAAPPDPETAAEAEADAETKPW
jgi:hypothetical protein